MGIFIMSDINIINTISKLAQEIESEDPIDWGDLSISESHAYDLVANEVFEKYKQTESIENERLVLLATIVKLTVENFTLNLKLMKSVKRQ